MKRRYYQKKKTYYRKQMRYYDSHIFYLTTFIFLALIIYLSMKEAATNNLVLILILFLFYIPSYILYKYLDRKKRIKKITKWRSINDLYNQYINCPTEFEGYIADLFRLQGYKAQVTNATNDGGIDIILHKDKKKYVVEVKLYNQKNKIGRERIQKLHSAMKDSATNAFGGFFVTTSDFIDSAKEYAQRNNITCVNGDKLIEWIEEYTNNAKEKKGE